MTRADIPDEVRMLMCSDCLPRLEEILQRCAAMPDADPFWTPTTLPEYWALFEKLALTCRRCRSRMKGWKELP